jgi:hypothetical protein
MDRIYHVQLLRKVSVLGTTKKSVVQEMLGVNFSATSHTVSLQLMLMLSFSRLAIGYLVTV